MGGRGGGSSTRSPIVVAQQTLAERDAMADQDIRDAYDNVIDIMGAQHRRNAGAGPQVSLLRLRTALSTRGWDRDRQDRELLRFVRERKGILIPESNQKALTKAHRDASLRVGNEDKHLISVKDV